VTEPRIRPSPRGLASVRATGARLQKRSGPSLGVLLYYYGSHGELISAEAGHWYATKVGEVRLRAARHDPDMREYLKAPEREFSRANFDLCTALLGDERAAHRRLPEFALVVVNSMLGAAASKPGHRSAEGKRLLETWRELPDLYFVR
jgi:hypothetical protein